MQKTQNKTHFNYKYILVTNIQYIYVSINNIKIYSSYLQKVRPNSTNN
jgi:hypothetical protein